MSIIAENRINKIYQYIESGPYTIEFNLEFGKGIDSTINPNDSRMDYTNDNKFLIDEVVFDDGAKNYQSNTNYDNHTKPEGTDISSDFFELVR